MHEPGWITPGWPAPAGVRAVCTSRAGGVSGSPFDSLNLGGHVGDDPRNVAANRERLAAATGARHVYMNQVHGRAVAQLDASTPSGVAADGCVTRERGIACTIMVADCLPVLLAARDGSIVGAAHAGWRGLAAGVIEATLEAMQARRGDVVAWLGPCIGPDEFEVGPDVLDAMTAFDASHARFFRPHAPGKWLADLPGLARARLAKAGVESIDGNDGSRDWCTVSRPSRFFSHRRDRVSGRLAACVWLG